MRSSESRPIAGHPAAKASPVGLSFARLAVVLSTLLLFSSPAAASATAEQATLPIATSSHIDQILDTTRLIFDMSAPVEADAFVISGPERVIVDLPEVSFQIDPKAGGSERPTAKPRGGRPRADPSEGLISSFRFGLFAPGKSRIVIDLRRPAKVLRAKSQARPDGRYRLEIELEPTDAATFQRMARVAAREAVAAVPEAPRAEAQTNGDARPLIVIDPGHGGIDSGAQGLSNTVEKDLVFEFSKVLEGKINESGRYRIQMTRNSDVFVSLADRVKFARNASASLFISIHADTLSEGAGVSGATVYTVSDKASDALAAKLAEKENEADLAAGLGGVEDGADVSDILFDLTRRETRTYSHVFARSLVSYWSHAGKLNKNPHRSAGFMVLKAPDVPSILLELGYLSSEKDVAVFTKPQWREKAADTMLQAIDKFFAGRIGTGPAVDGVASAVR